MKTIAVILADLETTPLGTRSRLAESIAGTPVLRRTVERVLRCKTLDAVHVAVPARQQHPVADLLAGLDVPIETYDGTPPAYRALVRACRWWGLDGWRGGIGGLCAMDEDLHVPLAAALARRTDAKAIVSIPAAAPLVDPALVDAMVAHHRENVSVAQFTFVQAPPGLVCAIFQRDALEELAPTGQPPGALIAYHPDQPAPDPTGKEHCYRPAATIVQAHGRLVCDTRRSFERVASLVQAGAHAWPAEQIADWLAQRATRAEPFPEEIEIELTTDDGWPADNRHHPRGKATGLRGPLDRALLEQLIDAINEWDDVRVVLGGFGDPRLHPQFAEVCALLRPAAAALAVRTSAVADAPAADAALFETPVDVIDIPIDAVTAGTYQRVHSIDAFDIVRARVEQWIERRLGGRQVTPLIVPAFTKSRLNLDEMETFYDRWLGRAGMAVLRGYSHCAKQRDDLRVTSTAPPQRVPCRRVARRAVILADGRVTTCDEDIAGRQTLGDLHATSFTDIWRSISLETIRTTTTPDTPLCKSCEEWHRP